MARHHHTLAGHPADTNKNNHKIPYTHTLLCLHLRQALKRGCIEQECLETLALLAGQVIDLVRGVRIVVVRTPGHQLCLHQPH